MSQLVEVRVLGSFRVRTEDGTLVDPRAWRTAKTRDLVRLLAVAGRLVSVDRIVDVLWPDVEPQRGRASLRTAASQIRHVLGDDHLVRRAGGFELSGAWVDAAAFEHVAATARHHLALGELATGITTAWEAVTLYGGDLCEDDTYAEWAAGDRDRCRGLLRRLLLDSADAACELGWLRDAVELGQRALDVDPCAERGYRTLMRAHSRLGETEQALGMFEQCRRTLADQLGADPGQETLALHLQLLRPTSPTLAAPPFVGRERALEQARSAMSTVTDEHRSLGVLVTGPPGSGRTRFAQEAAKLWPHRVVSLSCPRTEAPAAGAVLRQVARTAGGGRAPLPTAQGLRALLGPDPVLLVLDDLQWADDESVAVLAEALGQADDLLVLATLHGALPADHPLALTGRCDTVALPALSLEEVAAVLAPVLRGAPSTALVEELAEASAGTPAAVVTAARGLLSAGHLVSTPDGMVRVPRAGGGRTETRLASAREQIGAAGGRALDLLAVLDRCTPVSELARLGASTPRELGAPLDQLCDLGLVVLRGDGYALADALVREGAYRWLRPTVRRDLHRHVAESAYLPASARIEHWLKSGEPVLACAAALEAADTAVAHGDDVHARAHLQTVRSFAVENGVPVDDRIVLTERLAEAAERLGRRSEAQELLGEAIELARAGAPETLPRLHRALGRQADTRAAALLLYACAADVPGLSASEQRRTALAVAAVRAAEEPDVVVQELRQAVEDADEAEDVEVQVEARVLLARVSGQLRTFDVADRTAKEAMVLAESAGTPAMFVRSAHALLQAAAFLGDGLRQLPLLRRARELSLGAGDAREARDVGLTLCLVLHDLGDPEFAALWPQVSALTERGESSRLHDLVDACVSLERGQLGRAARLLDALPEQLEAVVADDAVAILRARLRIACHDPAGAAADLEGVLGRPRSAPGLFAAEAATRLAALVAPSDPARARRLLTRAGRLAGDRLHPREQVCTLRARAALLAAEGELDGAATLALAAALNAGHAGLVFQEAEALELRAELLAAGGHPGRAQAERDRAALLLDGAGAARRARPPDADRLVPSAQPQGAP